MLIAIVGTPSAGKRTVLQYLIEKHGFTQVGMESPADPMEGSKLLEPPMNNLSLSSTPATSPSESPVTRHTSVGGLLDFATRNWLQHHVTTDLRTYEDLEPFLKRPFFLIISVDGPLTTRFKREKERNGVSLDQFVEIHDKLHYGPSTPSTSSATVSMSSSAMTDFSRVMSLATIKVDNCFPTIEGLWTYLDTLNLLDEERLRPGWDTYFMTLASLASHRSNCMKRRVGALLVRSKRILSTGYNGTPRGTKNCNHGGCRRCNGSARGGESLDECLCLHAEENALLEAGRERIGEDSVIYCNTCPCLRCSVKIVQCGVREVVYNQSYSMDEASAAVLKEGGVILRQLHMP